MKILSSIWLLLGSFISFLQSHLYATRLPLYFMTLTLMDEVFLPSLFLLSSNCCLAEEI